MCSCDVGIINLREQWVHVFRLLTENAFYIMDHFLPFLLRNSTPHLSPKFECIVTLGTCTTLNKNLACRSHAWFWGFWLKTNSSRRAICSCLLNIILCWIHNTISEQSARTLPEKLINLIPVLGVKRKVAILRRGPTTYIKALKSRTWDELERRYWGAP